MAVVLRGDEIYRLALGDEEDLDLLLPLGGALPDADAGFRDVARNVLVMKAGLGDNSPNGRIIPAS